MFWIFIYIIFFYETYPGFKWLLEKNFCKKILIVRQKFLHPFFEKKRAFFFYQKFKKISKKSFISNFYNFLSTWSFFMRPKYGVKDFLKFYFLQKKWTNFYLQKKKKFLIFSKEFTAEKFLWNLTLENFSIFYQSLRDYNCCSNRCMVTCRVSKRIAWTRRTCWEIFLWPIAFPAKLNLLVFYSIFIYFELRESKISRYCQFGRPIGRFGQAQTNLQTFLSLKTFKISHNFY